MFRSNELRERLVAICPPLYQEALRQLLLNDLIILRLTSCKLKVLVEEVGKPFLRRSIPCICIYLDKLCKKQQLLCVQDIGPWVKFPDTLHEGYGHLAQVLGKV